MSMKLTEPDCEFGYTYSQLGGLLGDDDFVRFEGSGDDLRRRGVL